jgi:glycosyltransferase involved in cell wall biosynthesis
MVARATSQKDHLTAIKAVEYLKKIGINKKIVFLGDGEKLDEYKQYVDNHRLNDNCYFEGTRRDVCDYIAASHINILASRFEGLPTVIIEAMAFGKPCIMTNSDGGEVSGFGRYCILTPLGDYEAIGKALKQLYEDNDLYKKYCNLSLKRCEDFNPELIISEFEEFINE